MMKSFLYMFLFLYFTLFPFFFFCTFYSLFTFELMMMNREEIICLMLYKHTFCCTACTYSIPLSYYMAGYECILTLIYLYKLYGYTTYRLQTVTVGTLRVQQKLAINIKKTLKDLLECRYV